MKPEILEKREEKQILVFSSAGLELGLDISCVREVLKPQAIYPLPWMPAFIEGVINLRGRVVVLIDLAKRLDAGRTEEEPRKRIIVCRIRKFIIGLMVSRLKEIVALSRERIAPTPEMVSLQVGSEALSGIARLGDRIIPLLDLDRLLTQKEATELSVLNDEKHAAAGRGRIQALQGPSR